MAKSAESDLEEIFEYIAEDNPNAAALLVEELLEKFQMLSENKTLGRERQDLMLDLRGFPHKRYMIFYFSIDEGVEIFRVVHGARDIMEVFKNILPDERVN